MRGKSSKKSFVETKLSKCKKNKIEQKLLEIQCRYVVNSLRNKCCLLLLLFKAITNRKESMKFANVFSLMGMIGHTCVNALIKVSSKTQVISFTASQVKMLGEKILNLEERLFLLNNYFC